MAKTDAAVPQFDGVGRLEQRERLVVGGAQAAVEIKERHAQEQMIEDGPARRSHECGLLGAAEPLQHRGEQRAELGQRAKLGGVEFGHLTEAHEMEDPCLLPVLAQHDLDDVAGTSGRVAVLAGSHAQAGQRDGDAGSAQDRTLVADVRGLRIGDTQREPGGHARIGENAIPRTGTMDGEQAAVAVDQYLNR